MSSDPEARHFKSKREWRAEKLRQYNESEAAREREARERAERVAVDIVSPDSLTPVGFLEDTREPLPQGRLSHKQERLWRHVYELLADRVLGMSPWDRQDTGERYPFPSTSAALRDMFLFLLDGGGFKEALNIRKFRVSGVLDTPSCRGVEQYDRLEPVICAYRLAYDGPWDGGVVSEQVCRMIMLLQSCTEMRPQAVSEALDGLWGFEAVERARGGFVHAVSPRLVSRISKYGFNRVYSYLRDRDQVPPREKQGKEELVPVDKDSDLFGWEEVARALNVAESTAKRLHRDKGLPVMVFGGRIEANREELLAWKRDNTEYRKPAE